MLVIYRNDTYETLDSKEGQVCLRKPYSASSEPFWVSEKELIIYPRTHEDIVKQWIPDLDVTSNWHEPELYILEIYHAILNPKFLLAPKDPGVYTALWMDDNNHLEVTWILYNPGDSTLSESERLSGYDTFVIHKRIWIPLRNYIANSEYRYLRFIPFNLAYTYMYLRHLIETEHFTQEEVEEIWKRDRNSNRGGTDAIHSEQERNQNQYPS